MDNILEFHDFLNNEILTDNDINENFGSEFFDYEEYIAEKRLYNEDVLKEYDKIKPLIMRGTQDKEVTKRYFELETIHMKNTLEKDKQYVEDRVNTLIGKLSNLLNTEINDPILNNQRTNKIKLLKTYKVNQIKLINNEIKDMIKFYKSNPKFLITKQKEN